MYVLTPSSFGQAATAVPDVAAAIAGNRRYARALGWSADLARIARVLGVGTATPTERALVAAVARWQRRRGLPDDGVIGPHTWNRMRAELRGGPVPTAAPAAPRSVAAPLPALIARESDPRLATLYVRIVLGGEGPAPASTGIFIPEGYRPQPEVDVVLYLPGHKLGMRGVTDDVGIEAYWNRRRFPYWPLREGVNESGKNAVLVAPTLGPRSQAGRLTAPGGLDRYLAEVLAALTTYGPHRDGAPTLGSLILACHSGGGLPMRQLALSSQTSATRIRECWGFDCLYGTRAEDDADAWTRWARLNPSARLFVYYLDTTTTMSTKLAARRLPNVVVERSRARDHFWVPITHWTARLQNAPLRRR